MSTPLSLEKSYLQDKIDGLGQNDKWGSFNLGFFTERENKLRIPPISTVVPTGVSNVGKKKKSLGGMELGTNREDLTNKKDRSTYSRKAPNM